LLLSCSLYFPLLAVHSPKVFLQGLHPHILATAMLVTSWQFLEASFISSRQVFAQDCDIR
jgi:hypothetical protein